MNPIKRIIVSGSSGTIGTALCERLLSDGFDVIGVDKAQSRWNPAMKKKTVSCDLTKASALKKIPAKADLFIHLAANPFVFPSVKNPKLAFDNVNMTLNALEFCRTNGIKRFIFASSREVYGNTAEAKHEESDVRIENTESPYSASKVTGESFVHAYQKCFGIDFQIVRFSNVYGKFDVSERFIPIVLAKCRKNEQVTIFGQEKSLSFTYVDDVVEGVIDCIRNFETAKNEAYNIAHPDAVSVLAVAEKIRQKLNSKSEIRVTTIRTGEVEKFFPVITKAQRRVGFNPRTSIDEGLDKTIAWYNTHVFRK